MRFLRIVVSRTRARTRGTLPALVLATLLPSGSSCSASVDEVSAQGAGGSGGASASASSSGGAGGVGGFTVASSASSTGAGGNDCSGGVEEIFVVEIPPEGVPASVGQICAVMMSTVESNKAARVTLTKDPQALHLAKGLITLAPELAGTVIGAPAIAVVDAWTPEIYNMMVANITPTAEGFSFDASWPPPLNVYSEPWSRMTLKTTMEIACDAMATETRMVEAITHIHLCDDAADLEWVSSGDECKVCSIIAEMAPSPIVPDKAHDDLPLARALRLRVVPLARVGRTVVLLAENDGGADLAYSWRSTAGTLVELAPDVVVWTPPEGRGPCLIQAAVHGDDVAAVASFTWEEAA
jgi:hypothetical protein